MDIRHFASLQRMIASEPPRRRLLALLATLPLLGGLSAVLTGDDAEGRGRRRRRKKRHKHGKGRRRARRTRRRTCARCAGCCDSSRVCQPGATNAACGSGGGTCAVCAGQEQCQGQACVCVPDCAGKCAGAPDGCGGTCTGGCAGGRVCLGNGTCAVPCPGGGPDCAAAGCASNRCIGTNQGPVCSLSDGQDGCSGDNAQCPFGRACSGVSCEVVC